MNHLGQEKTIELFKLPASINIEEFEERIIETKKGFYRLLTPVLTENLIKEITDTIKSSRDYYLMKLSINEIVDKIDQAVQKWLNPHYPLRQLAELLLPPLTGYDAEMIRLELKQYMRNFRKKELLRFIDEELDQATILDEFRPRKTGGMSMAFGPSLIFHVFSGNVPGVQLWSLIMGLLVKSANLGKTSSSEPLMAVLFGQSLAEVDERLAETLAILPWKGGTEELELPSIEAAEAIIVYGSNTTVEKIRPMVPYYKRFLTYGHKISFALIGKEALTADRYYETIHHLAEDISIYDQQSCLSPQLVMIEKGGGVSPKQAAQLLASELERYHLKRPRAVLKPNEAMAIQKARHHYTFAAMENPEEITVYQSQGDTAWTVIFHYHVGFELSPLNRTVHVFTTEKLEEDLHVLRPYQHYLQSCGAAVKPERLFSLAKELGSIGVDRISAIGEMNHARPGWHHDGGLNLLSLVRFIDIEKTAEEKAEHYDPDVE
ncbi:acyl-CoA reductase [Pullulanibacillus sp. KACC 23026]|uniref:acyl-CoA reductase n=1 Tax=Pullulanibacillus sp. KACC 23026 TaxID=3028315 RepID=UPI0023B11C34|nr:acyl-CoA reductase [Pullulanibacillus sp. KACC 23026]WEG14642.1 acyl-CoA reductase [Pullulanibacillus sp. KACC 23026]